MNNSIPIIYSIEEIKNHLVSLPEKEQKVEYLIKLYNIFIKICYNLSDNEIKRFLISQNIIDKFPEIPYLESADYYQTHISGSKYIKFLKLIDEQLLPFIRTEIIKHDNSFEEDDSAITSNLSVFNYDHSKVLEYSNKLGKLKLNYLSWILNKRYKYFADNYERRMSMISYKRLIANDSFLNEISKRISVLQRYPELEKDILEEEEANAASVPSLFINDETLCGFDINKIKIRAKQMPSSEESLIYLLHVKKEALQNQELMPHTGKKAAFIDLLDIEIKFYESKNKIENKTRIDELASKPAEKNVEVSVKVDTSPILNSISNLKNELDLLGKGQKHIPNDKLNLVLCNHYFNTALQLKSIPKQKDLITDKLNKTFISRRFNDIVFLTLLIKYIERKMEDERYGKNKMDLLIECRDNVKVYLEKAQLKDDISTGITSKRKPDYNPNIRSSHNIFDDEEDNRYLSGR